MLESRPGTHLITTREQDSGPSNGTLLVPLEAQLLLRKSGYRELQFLSCDFHEGVLTLRGRVPSFFLKQVAQTVIREVEDVGEVNNRLEVTAPARSPTKPAA